MPTITIYTDGLCEPRNPGGTACWAWVALGPSGKQLNQAAGCLGSGQGMSNNVAEYEGVLQALRYAWGRVALLVERGLGLEIRSDSQLVIYQITGRYRTNAPDLVPLRDEAHALQQLLAAQGVTTTFTWVPRELNTTADALTREAYQAARRSRRGTAYATG